MRELPSAGIRITTQGEQRVTIECGRSKFKLLGLPREEFPSFPQVAFDGSSKTTARELQKLIAHVAFAASTEESRPVLNGVLWQLLPDRMRMVATNGHRLAKMEIPMQSTLAQQAELIVPPKALEQFRKLFGPDDEIEIGRSDNHLGFRSATTQVFTRLIEGPYPNYEQVIPRENDKVATVEKASLMSALRRMSIVASDQTHRIRMAFGDGSCRLSVTTPDLGEAQEEITVSYEGEPLDIGFNANYLLEVLEVHADRRSPAHVQGARARGDGRAGGLGRSGGVFDAGDAVEVAGLKSLGKRLGWRSARSARNSIVLADANSADQMPSVERPAPSP